MNKLPTCYSNVTRLVLFAAFVCVVFSQQLPSLNVQPNSITVSGVSSGGAMAIQMHVAYSASISGVAAIAAPPYWCAMDLVEAALNDCMSSAYLISLDVLWTGTSAAYAEDSIDNPTNLVKSPVWLFSGTEDTVVEQAVVDKTYKYYSEYISPSNIKYYKNFSAEHSWITNNYGNACNNLGTPYINNCGFDASGDLLSHLYGKSLNPKQPMNQSAMLSFKQNQYTPLNVDPSDLSMAELGFIYVPKACYSTSCSLHIALHGCLQYYELIGKDFIESTGLNEWAESNNIIVLYPQATDSELVPFNPKGCWDWWGYTGTAYATQLGPQMDSIWNMVKELVPEFKK